MPMKKMILLFFLFSFLSVAAQKKQPYKIIAYYTGNGETIKQYPVDKLTHLIYSFLKLQNDTLTFRDSIQQITVQQLVALKQDHPQLKIMVSIGGVDVHPAAIYLQTPFTGKILLKLLLHCLKNMVLTGLTWIGNTPPLKDTPDINMIQQIKTILPNW